jgi:type II secretory pathway predicted ATPase ExeA
MNFAYFGLKRMPFSKEINTDNFYNSYDQKEAIARLNYIKQYRGIFLLTGEPGGGKTSILRQFVAGLNPQSHECCYTPHATVSRSEIYKQLTSLLNLDTRGSKSGLFKRIQDGIWEKYRHQGITPCIILDESHLMDHMTMQELVLLTNFEMDSKLPFILILSGQPTLKDYLKRRNLEALNQRITLRYHVGGLSFEETREYVIHHLKLAGRSEDDPLFDENCYEMIHQLSLGLPRKIGQICLSSMTYAQIKKEERVTTEIIHSAGIEL